MFLEKGMITRIRQRRGMLQHVPTEMTLFAFILRVLRVFVVQVFFAIFTQVY
jgi:hypothetical protein